MSGEDCIAKRLRGRLARTKTFKGAFKEFELAVMSLGYEGVLYGCAPSIFGTDPIFTTPVFKACGLYSDELLERYVLEGLVKYDFTVKAILNGEEGDIDWFLPRHKNQLTIQEVRLLEIAESFGLMNGLSLPIMNNGNGFAGISVASSKDRDEFDRLNRECLDNLRLCMHTFNDYIWTHLAIDIYRLYTKPVLDTLSPIEKDYLRLLPAGKKVMEISTIIKRVPGQVERIGSRVRKKFGGVSTIRLIYYSGLLRFDKYL